VTYYLKKALETFDGRSTSRDVTAALQHALQSAGLQYFCMNLFPQSRQEFSDQIVACEVPSDWLELYLREDFASVDPAIRHCRRMSMPFAYQDAPYDAGREPRAAEVVRRANDFGVGDGILIPLTDSSGCVGDLWVGGRTESFQYSDVPLVHILALYAFHKFRQLTHSAPDKKAFLSAREVEVLHWVAEGKTAWEIGEVLNISQRTVEWHIQQAMQKLGAKNRMQAVVIAARDHLIEI
jgi:DNA-binding CsgD family transcriptional regulator